MANDYQQLYCSNHARWAWNLDMKAFFVTIILVLSVQCTEAADFRQATFGMSTELVKATESGARWLVDTPDLLGFESTVAGLRMNVAYVFVDNQFVRGIYAVNEPHTNLNRYIDDFKKIATLIETKYGEPSESETLWESDDYKDDKSHWGLAAAIGQLHMFKMWNTKIVEIVLFLTGDNYEIHLQAEYTSVELGALETKNNLEKSLDDF